MNVWNDHNVLSYLRISVKMLWSIINYLIEYPYNTNLEEMNKRVKQFKSNSRVKIQKIAGAVSDSFILPRVGRHNDRVVHETSVSE